MDTSNFKYEIAFSFCSEDLSFAEEIVNNLNPSLHEKIFLYTKNQKDLISNIGIEQFSNIFKFESRIVVLLYRNTYGKSSYTKIEQQAIIDRILNDNANYDFLFLIPLTKDCLPSWYSRSKIYADPFNFSISELAKFIEFKVNEKGGIMEPLNFKDKLESILSNYHSKLKSKENLYDRSTSFIIDNIKNDISNAISTNLEDLKNAKFPISINYNSFSKIVPSFSLTIEDKILEFMLIEPANRPVLHSQSVRFYCKISSIYYENHGFEKSVSLIESQYYRINIVLDAIGFSEEFCYTDPFPFEQTFLFNDGNIYYDLQKFYSINSLIEIWFSRFIDLVKFFKIH